MFVQRHWLELVHDMRRMRLKVQACSTTGTWNSSRRLPIKPHKMSTNRAGWPNSELCSKPSAMRCETKHAIKSGWCHCHITERSVQGFVYLQCTCRCCMKKLARWCDWKVCSSGMMWRHFHSDDVAAWSRMRAEVSGAFGTSCRAATLRHCQVFECAKTNRVWYQETPSGQSGCEEEQGETYWQG